MPCIAVLGVHRSGTSAAAGVLHHLGVGMGKNLMGPGPSNPKGHFEDMPLVTMNALAIGGWGAWSDPQYHMTPELERRYAIYVTQRSREGLWGIKDPRLCFTLQNIRKHVADGMRVVAMYRDKDAIVKSLCARKGAGRFTPEEATKVWARYMHAMQQRLDELGDPERVLPVEFDDLIDDPRGTVGRLMAFSIPGASCPLTRFEEATQFVDPTLRHQGGRDA